MEDERAFIERFEAADPDELARQLTLCTRREADALAAHLGERRYRQMHEEALRRNVRRSEAEPLGNVVVIPGLLGSELSSPDGLVWLRPLKVLAGVFAQLRLDPSGLDERVKPAAVIVKHYGELILSLASRYRVLPFPYDWRKDVRLAGHELNARIANAFGDEPVHLVAHSLGGLVARSFIADHPERWGGRLILVGGGSSYEAFRALAGRDRLIALLAAADTRLTLGDVQRVLTSFPALYQLLPPDEVLYERSAYDPVDVSQAHLDLARGTHARLEAIPEHVHVIAGSGQPTYVGVDAVSRAGDGRVPLALLPDAPTYYAEAAHGDLPRDRLVLQAIHELLEAGETTVLAREPREPRGGDPIAAHRAREDADAAELDTVVRQLRVREATAAEHPRLSEAERVLGDVIVRGWLAEPETAQAAAPSPKGPLPTVAVQLVHGDITSIHELGEPVPVDALAVGHYMGVKPQDAEAELDRAISAALPAPTGGVPEDRLLLTQLTLRGTIAGDLGQPFLLPDPRAPERLIAVIGLGLPGRLGSGELTVAVRELCWAAGRLGRRHLASVLIGSGHGNLPSGEAAEAWANGIAQGLAGQDIGAPRLDVITLVERDEQRVREIEVALQRVAERLRARDELELTYIRGTDRPPRDAPEEQAAVLADRVMPTRMTISREPRGYRFGAITQVASIPERVIPLDAKLVNQANDELAGEADDDLRHERGRFLGRLLMPRDLREQLSGAGPIVMILDAATARIHWELVTRAGAEAALPGVSGQLEDYLGLGLGVTRQLRTTFAQPPEPPPPPDRLLRALVVADPAEDAHLPGAEEEGSAIADLFDRVNAADHPVNVEVVRLFGPRQATRTEVLRRLLLERFHVMHFAGHCFYNPKEPSASGWIFSDGQTLSAHELQRIDRVPEFIFSNACESGITPDRSGERSAALAPSFAESFFARGVGNFVCTAWPVDDAAARTFALELYRGLLGLVPDEPPRPMYQAMQRAREAIVGSAGGARSWGAYQHYGDPLYRLVAVR